MATGTNLAASVGTKIMLFTAGVAMLKDQIELLGGRVLMAFDDIVISTEGVYRYASERLEAPKAAVDVVSGETIYWDNTAKAMTNVVGSNTMCGIALEDAASGVGLIVMELDNSVNS